MLAVAVAVVHVNGDTTHITKKREAFTSLFTDHQPSLFCAHTSLVRATTLYNKKNKETMSACQGGPITENGTTSIFKSNGLMATSGTSEQVGRFAMLIVTSVFAGAVFLFMYVMANKASKRNAMNFDVGIFGPQTGCNFAGPLITLGGLIITLYLISTSYCFGYWVALVTIIMIILCIMLYSIATMYWKELSTVTNNKIISVRTSGSLMTLMELTLLVLLLIAPGEQGTRANVVASITFLPMLLYGFSAMKAGVFKNEKRGETTSAGLFTGSEPEEEM